MHVYNYDDLLFSTILCVERSTEEQEPCLVGAAFREHSGEHSRNTQETFREHPNNMLQTRTTVLIVISPILCGEGSTEEQEPSLVLAAQQLTADGRTHVGAHAAGHDGPHAVALLCHGHCAGVGLHARMQRHHHSART
jgi:hypothetical protein